MIWVYNSSIDSNSPTFQRPSLLLLPCNLPPSYHSASCKHAQDGYCSANGLSSWYSFNCQLLMVSSSSSCKGKSWKTSESLEMHLLSYWITNVFWPLFTERTEYWNRWSSWPNRTLPEYNTFAGKRRCFSLCALFRPLRTSSLSENKMDWCCFFFFESLLLAGWFESLLLLDILLSLTVHLCCQMDTWMDYDIWLSSEDHNSSVGGIRLSARICPCFHNSVDPVRPAESVSWSNTLLLL